MGRMTPVPPPPPRPFKPPFTEANAIKVEVETAGKKPLVWYIVWAFYKLSCMIRREK